ncbi:hypothetical protein Dthio_PD1563 [Desulfonatronospira thiodismutans ASO3-1]|uniref:Methyltransferase n=1 Tax=Desulfonatronospira thiodismutans ASO3-1 TaxID=555779 RepID=D6SN86_9BACT|nr:TylF/MycF/NovP-related O-methyltransferase [Desulfonatronospira thiodismutans]EFI34212.1 hypothetical protein Dthio_PD1563 [Desulfonatronospira thiodismutans ASO3-1]
MFGFLKKKLLSKSAYSEKELISAILKQISDKKLKSLLRIYRKGKLDPKRFRSAMVLYNRATYLEDLLGTKANATFLEDSRFKEAYQAAASVSTWGRDIRWRVYNLIKFAGVALRLEGEFVECGVDRGGMSLALLTYYPEDLPYRRFWLFDTFQGLVYEQMNEMEREKSPFLKERNKDRYPPIYEEVCRTFSGYENINIIPGMVPETLEQFSGQKVAFLHIDMNVAYPEVKALEFFWPYLVPGGVVVLDDYGFPLHTEQKHAMDACVSRLGTDIILQPTGQGLIIK